MYTPGTILTGDRDIVEAAHERMNKLPIDWDLSGRPVEPLRNMQTTLAASASISGLGTFMGKAKRTIRLEPSETEGWWLNRIDLPGALPIRVGIDNVWTTGQIVSNIVLRSGNPHNYVRMVEHLISLRMGMGIDNLIIGLDSADPPLFEQGCFNVVKVLNKCGTAVLNKPVRYVTVKKPVTAGGAHGEFVTLEPPENPADPRLLVDCAIDFKTAIGRQRVVFPVCRQLVEMAAVARTNTSFSKMLYCKTFGKLFADIRHLGYNNRNVSIAGKKRYFNSPRLLHKGKALEAVWHRATQDLLAAIALISDGFFVGKVISYKAGHRLDCELIRQLYLHKVLVPLEKLKEKK